ncbi:MULTISPECIES: TetR/AcrR family transcriptional regulator [unclassified Chelatococcus]|uniref:TetR/AcrR family transcriptional regulator n=1 Tax=unclassified Chelatococcus TaxID=2638111 RepID=UPI001BCAFCFB|nr:MULTISPECIES: TetR/AcrR family transcriptional regulator [unclassified Chelatococcus]MBS7700331.1 TetR/AcrR family transcriptional regulator [Chelatococcus sp. YT9]MBX3556127.1 TetR/AcrR family transcriptional regulator [Chelatococcus sp.]
MEFHWRITFSKRCHPRHRLSNMPRPKLHSDEFILNTALGLILKKGPSAFTLTDVAEAVGISRAALIQRFKDKATLHHRVMERTTQQVREYFVHIDPTPGLDPLWAMLTDLIGGMGQGDGMEGYLLLMWGDVQEEALRMLSAERNGLVRAAIESKLPPTPHCPERAASLIQSVIQGSCLQWFVEPEGELSTFMLNQTKAVLEVLYPGHHFS